MRSRTDFGALGLAAGLAVLTVASCENPIRDDYRFTAVLEPLATPYTDPPAVDVGPSAFEFRSTMPFPCQPSLLVPRVTALGSQLTLRVEGRYRDGCPHDVTGVLSFRVDVMAVPAGTYARRVIQSHREWNLPPDTVFVGDMTVP